MKQYKRRNGSYILKTDEQAQMVGEHIEYLMKTNNNEVSPTLIVQDAKSKKSPLHTYFEWDNDKASKDWRLQQARQLLNNIVEVVVVKGVENEQKSFFNVVNSKQERVYVKLDTVLRDSDYRVQLIEQAETQIQAFMQTLRLMKQKL